MKPHLILKIRDDVDDATVPHWREILKDKSRYISPSQSLFKKVFRIIGLPAWLTKEYQPKKRIWNEAELQNGLNRIYRLILQKQTNLSPSIINQISFLPEIEYVRLGRIGTTDLPHPVLSEMSGVTGTDAREMIYLSEAHRWSRGHQDVTIAVLDTGVDLSHPELKDNLLPGYDFVDIIDGAGKFIGDFLGQDTDPTDQAVGHGTHVAGIIAAKGEKMPLGMVPNCKLLPVRVLGAMQRGGKAVGAGLVDNINDAIKWAVDQGADVINMSLGIRHTGGGLPHEEVVNYARQKNVTIVAASGNDGQDTLYYPGALPHVIAVGAADEQGKVAQFSTYGKQVDMVAPGTNIYSTYLNGGYAFSSGTSHAAPFVSGAAALLKSYAMGKGRQLTDRQIKHIFKHTTDKAGRSFRDHKAGFGMLNLPDALRLLEHQFN